MAGRGYKTPDAEVRGRVACRGLFAGSKTQNPQSTLATTGQRGSDWINAGLHARLGKSTRTRVRTDRARVFRAVWLHAMAPQQPENATGTGLAVWLEILAVAQARGRQILGTFFRLQHIEVESELLQGELAHRRLNAQQAATQFSKCPLNLNSSVELSHCISSCA